MSATVLPFDDHSTIQAQAREWLIRLDRDDPPSAQEAEALRSWMAQSPAHRAELSRISAFWDDANVLNELSTPVYDQTGFSFSRLLQPLLNRSKRFHQTAAFASAACLALVIAFVLMPAPSNSSNGIYASAIGTVEEQQLVDGTVIQINTDSQVQVDYSDSVRKIRLLRGEAHFAVAPNSDWPFDVYAGNGMVKAIGTAFAVRLNNGSIKVTVSHGHVDLASTTQATAQSQVPQLQTIGSLNIGQTATFTNKIISTDEQPIQSRRSLKDDELNRQLSWRTGYLVFEGEPLIEVINEINRYTPIDIQVADPELQQIRVGGRFKVGELDAMFDVLQTSFGIQVNRISDQRIALHSAQIQPVTSF